MKISNSKKELARIISENGGWRDGAESAAQCKSDNAVSFYRDVPDRDGDCWWGEHLDGCDINQGKLIASWHQSCLSSEEYFNLYPAPDADGWIEWGGGFIPVRYAELVDVKYANGTVERGFSAGCYAWNWSGDDLRIIAYRLHKPGQAKPEFCESVTRSIQEPESKPTIEQLAADYHNRKDYADRKQQEADEANAEAEAKLAELVAAGNAIGLVISVAEKEPELVITDWRDLMIGDIIEYVDGAIKDKIGMTGPVVEFAPDATDGMHVRLKCDNGPHKGRLGWPREWRFIRRPAK